MTGRTNAAFGGGEVIYGVTSNSSPLAVVNSDNTQVTITLPQNIKKLCGLTQNGRFADGTGFCYVYPSSGGEEYCNIFYTDKDYPDNLMQTSATGMSIEGNKIIITVEPYHEQISRFFATAYTYIPA